MSIKKLHREIMLSAVYQLERRARSPANVDKDSGNRFYWRANRAAHDGRAAARLGAVRVGRARHEDGRAVGAADAVLRAPHALRQGEPLPARSVPAAVRLPGADHLRRAALHHQRAAAAAVPHEQRLHAAAGGAARADASRPSRTRRAQIRRRIARSSAATPSASELAAGLEYLADEPLRAYEERKAEGREEAEQTSKKPDAGAREPARRRRNRTTDDGRRA